MSAISINSLWKKYGKTYVLRNINLSVDEGVFFALMGPNGSGKTTLVSILACTNKPTEGSLEVLGYNVVDNVNKAKSVIGYVPQDNFTSSHLTGKENLTYFARLSGLKRSTAKKVAEDLLEKMDLLEHANKRVSLYSGGMRKRLEVATALMPGTKVLILDEPTTGFDPTARRKFLELIRKIRKELNITIILVTHIGEDAEIADTVGIMYGGEIIIEDNPNMLIKNSGLRNIVELQTSSRKNGVIRILQQFTGKNKDFYETKEGIKFFHENPAKIIPKIISTLETNGYQLSKIEMKPPSLEDVFYKLTKVNLGL